MTGRRFSRHVAAALLTGALLAGCGGPYVQPPARDPGPPAVEARAFRMPDGARLPYRLWPARGPARAVIVAVHGMNDYSRAFAEPAASWLERGIHVYAYDQRGFGAAPRPGLWAGHARLAGDLRTVIALVKGRHPGVPVFVLGESMGAAVVIAALGAADAPPIAGAILVAPAVWNWQAMPWQYRWSLTAAVRIAPWAWLKGSGLGLRPTDNIRLWHATSRDPKVIKGARVDTLWGVVQLFDSAWAAAPRVRSRLLLVYGARDEIVPRRALVRLIRRLPRKNRTFAYYKDGWHWLLRDLQRWAVHDDISTWMLKPGRPFESGAEVGAAKRLAPGPWWGSAIGHTS